MDLFVYGTLRSAALLEVVAGEAVEAVAADLPGYAVHPVAGDCVPLIAEAPGATTAGLLVKGLSQQAMMRLDLYEGAFGYSLTPVQVLVAGVAQGAQVYLPPVAQEAGEGVWSLADWEAEHLAPALLAAGELFSRDPLPDHATARQLWAMIERRAWAQHRAAQRHRPSERRHAARPGDLTIEGRRPPAGSFFALQSFDLRHRQFDGNDSGVLSREVFWGTDAALVLPYDPVSDRVLLVEQARMGPALLGEANPWVLEPIAGMVDARETPEDCALRETREEAGIAEITLERIAAFYPSPGSSTDYFHAYVGLCRLGDETRQSGGVAEEAEDLRLHPMPFEEAMALVESGEIAAGPLVMMLYWLALNRARLRG